MTTNEPDPIEQAARAVVLRFFCAPSHLNSTLVASIATTIWENLPEPRPLTKEQKQLIIEMRKRCSVETQGLISLIDQLRYQLGVADVLYKAELKANCHLVIHVSDLQDELNQLRSSLKER